MEATLAAVEAWPLAASLRRSLYLYPLVNALHIIGLALLFGAIVPLDLRLLGFFRTVPIQPLARILPGIAASGLLLAIAAGALLFIVRPLDYWANPAFLTKLTLVSAATANALAQQSGANWRSLAGGGEPSGAVRVRASLSLVLWSAAIIAGRAIGYLD